jgi:hypothetical protein
MHQSKPDQSNPSEPIETLVEQVRSGAIGRRDFLRRAVTTGVSSAIAYSLLGQASATAQHMTTYAVGEESSSLPTPPTSTSHGEEHTSPPATTYAVGEEGGPTYSYGEGQPNPTTFAVGEEQPPSCNRPPATTRAYGEEGHVTPPITTQAVGEEGPVSTRAYGEEGHVTPPSTVKPTTWSTGEEGSHQHSDHYHSDHHHSASQNSGGSNRSESSTSPQRQIQSTIRQQLPKVWKGFGRW